MSYELATVERNLALGNIESYISWANQIPLLSQAEELELTNKLKNNNDIEAAKKLILHHLRFVIHVAKGYMGYGLPLADLIQEGNIGLMKAIKKFNPTEGVRLVSYAVHWIKSEIHEYVIKNIKAVSSLAPTKNMRKLFFKLRSLKSSLTDKKWLNSEQVKIIADKLNVSEKEVLTMEQRLEPYTDISIDSNPYESENNNDYAPVNDNILEDSTTKQDIYLENLNWNSARSKKLNDALDQITPRERQIIELRWLCEQKKTLQELSTILNISTERVRQLESKALVNLRKLINPPTAA
ncbi:MAG: RNA polymerase sigma factor RpoH [Pseudomonadota bacterium]|nr:RNA polymerase sigma factor RpoH [Pseudomonadota bacterium]